MGQRATVLKLCSYSGKRLRIHKQEYEHLNDSERIIGATLHRGRSGIGNVMYLLDKYHYFEVAETKEYLKELHPVREHD